MAGILEERGAREVLVVRNAVDLSEFSEEAGSCVPEDLSILPRPRVVYVGALNERFNTRWIIEAAARLERANFILIGLFTLVTILGTLAFFVWLASVQINKQYQTYGILFEDVSAI